MAGKKKSTKKENPLKIGVDFAYSNRDESSFAMLRGSTLSNVIVDEAAVLDMDTIDEAIASITGRSIQSVKLPTGLNEPSSWVLAMTMALLRVFRMKFKEGGPSAMGSMQPMILEMFFPLGQHAYTQQAVRTTGHGLLKEMNGNDEQNKLHARITLCEDMILDNFKSLEKWVDIANRAKSYTVKELLGIENIEQRMAAMRIFGAEKLIEEAGAVLVSKSARGNFLFKIPRERGLFEEDAYFLKYQCVSTGRIYVSGVPPELFDLQGAAANFGRSSMIAASRGPEMTWRGWSVRQLSIEGKYMKQYPKECWADLAMAWKFRLTYEEYCRLSRQNEG